MSYIDSCCFDCFLRNSLVALLEALFAQVMHTKGGCDVQMRRIWCMTCKEEEDVVCTSKYSFQQSYWTISHKVIKATIIDLWKIWCMKERGFVELGRGIFHRPWKSVVLLQGELTSFGGGAARKMSLATSICIHTCPGTHTLLQLATRTLFKLWHLVVLLQGNRPSYTRSDTLYYMHTFQASLVATFFNI